MSLYLRRARNQGWLTLEDLDALDDITVAEGLPQLTAPSRDGTFKMPDFDYVHAELAKPHVTLKLLWEEHVERCRQRNERFYMETQFRWHNHQSTIIASQFEPAEWLDQIPIAVAAEAITDRLSSQAYKIVIKGKKSMRETIHA